METSVAHRVVVCRALHGKVNNRQPPVQPKLDNDLRELAEINEWSALVMWSLVEVTPKGVALERTLNSAQWHI